MSGRRAFIVARGVLGPALDVCKSRCSGDICGKCSECGECGECDAGMRKWQNEEIRQ